MPINAQNRSLPDWFTRIRTRQTVLPRFQRFEAWSHSNITQVFNTILQGLPVGAVLVLEVGNEEPFISRSLVGAPAQGERVTEHLLDGQQRLTALWRGLHNNYEDRTYFLYLEPDEETGTPFYVDSIARWKNQGDQDRRPFWANSPKRLWERRMVPLDMCLPGDAGLANFRAWARDAIEDRDEREDISDLVMKVREAFVTFNLPFLALPAITPKDVALGVFLKMNTSAEPLSIYDIVVAQVEAGTGTSLHDLVAEARRECPAISSYYDPGPLVLYVNALLENGAPTNSTYVATGFGQTLTTNWQRILNGVQRAVQLLEEDRIFDATRLPTDVAVAVLAALCASAPRILDAGGRARATLKKYLWRAFFTNRYERSTTSRSQADFREVRDFLNDAAATPAIFDDRQYPLPGEAELIAASWPKKKDRLARAILALALRNGGQDLADGAPIARANIEQREYHHLFPNAHLKRIGLADEKIFRALNCALVTWQTNRNMGGQEPERYLAQRREGANLGEAEIRHRLATHIVPYDEMVAGDYDAFLARRAHLVHERMTTLCTAVLD